MGNLEELLTLRCHAKLHKDKLEVKSLSILIRREQKRLWNRKNKIRIDRWNAEWFQSNRDKSKVVSREYYHINKIKSKIRAAKWRSDNKERCKFLSNKWRALNKGKINSYVKFRKLSKIKRTPIWLTKDDLKQIAEIYKEANRLSVETKTKHHVDHIIPLQGKNVSGLHVPSNLQILTATENCRKSNKY